MPLTIVVEKTDDLCAYVAYPAGDRATWGAGVSPGNAVVALLARYGADLGVTLTGDVAQFGRPRPPANPVVDAATA